MLVQNMTCVVWCVQLGRLEREGRVSNDEQHILEKSIQEMTDKHIAEIDEMIGDKTKELTSV